MKNTPFDKKLHTFFQLADWDNSGKLSQSEMYEILKRNVRSKEEKELLKDTSIVFFCLISVFILIFVVVLVATIFREADRNNDGELDFEELSLVVLENPKLRIMLEDTFNQFEKANRMIDNELSRPHQAWVPIGGFSVTKEGIHYPAVKQMLNVVELNENRYETVRTKRQEMKDYHRKMNYNLFGQEEKEEEEELSFEVLETYKE